MSHRKRRSGNGDGIADRIGILLLVCGLLLFVCFGAIPLGEIVHHSTRYKDPIRMLAWYVTSRLYLLLGFAAYWLPFCMVIIGVIRLWWARSKTRLHILIRLLLSIPALAAALTIISVLCNKPPQTGGWVGRLYYNYIEVVLGSTGAAWVGLMLLMPAAWFLLGIRSPSQGVLAHSIGAIINALAAALRFVFHAIPARLLSLAPSSGRHPTRNTITSSSNQPVSQQQPWMPNTSGNWIPPQTNAPWIRTSPPETTDNEDESLLKPLPLPAVLNPVPIEILPDRAVEPPSLGALRDRLPAIRNMIIDIVQRTSQVELVASSTPPLLGLNAILFEFAKRERQSVSVKSVERAIHDIGVETRRSPIRLRLEDAVRIELPLLENERSFAPIKALLQETSRDGETPITYLIGRRQDGTPYELEITDARHMLVGGSTGGGKTVLLHTIIFGIIFRYSPARIRLALVDNKAIEFSSYRGMPHLWQEVVTTPRGFLNLVDNLVEELERRKRATAADPSADFPVILTIVDEFSQCDSSRLVRLIAESRALNMFFILATQHPTADVISTSIKANLVTGIALKTQLPSGSQLIIGTSDAVSLLGKGDCLVSSPTGLVRTQAGWVTGPKGGPLTDIGVLAQFLRDSTAG